MYVKLSRDKLTGDWYTTDKKYCIYRGIYRGSFGWFICEFDKEGFPDFFFPLFFGKTLSDVRNILAAVYYNS